MSEYLTSKEVAEKCDERYADSDETLFKLDTAFIEEHLPEGCHRLIDLGCGTGRQLVHFARKGIFVWGVDVNPHMLVVAERKLRDIEATTILLEGDMADPPAEATGLAFDAALCMFNTLECLKPEDQARAGKAAYRLLRPGGVYIFQVHNGNVGEKVRKGGHKGEPSVPLYFLSELDVRTLLREAGFKIVDLRYIAANRAEYDEAENAPQTAYGMIVAARKP